MSTFLIIFLLLNYSAWYHSVCLHTIFWLLLTFRKQKNRDTFPTKLLTWQMKMKVQLICLNAKIWLTFEQGLNKNPSRHFSEKRPSQIDIWAAWKPKNSCFPEEEFWSTFTLNLVHANAAGTLQRGGIPSSQQEVQMFKGSLTPSTSLSSLLATLANTSGVATLQGNPTKAFFKPSSQAVRGYHFAVCLRTKQWLLFERGDICEEGTVSTVRK